MPSAIGRAKIEKKNVSPRSPPFLSHLQIKPSGSGDENVANIFRLFFSLSSRFPFAFLFIASMKSWLASISYKGTNLICKISSIFFPKCCLLFVCKTVRISQNLLLNEKPVESSTFVDTVANYHWSRENNMPGSKYDQSGRQRLKVSCK